MIGVEWAAPPDKEPEEWPTTSAASRMRPAPPSDEPYRPERMRPPAIAFAAVYCGLLLALGGYVMHLVWST